MHKMLNVSSAMAHLIGQFVLYCQIHVHGTCNQLQQLASTGGMSHHSNMPTTCGTGVVWDMTTHVQLLSTINVMTHN